MTDERLRAVDALRTALQMAEATNSPTLTVATETLRAALAATPETPTATVESPKQVYDRIDDPTRYPAAAEIEP